MPVFNGGFGSELAPGRLAAAGAQLWLRLDQDEMRRLNWEEPSRLATALSCLRSAADAGDGSDPCCPEPPQEPDVFPPSSTPPTPAAVAHGRSVSISVLPCSDERTPDGLAEGADPRAAGCPRTPPRHKLLQMLPNILTRSQESQLANRLEGPETPRSSPQTPRRDIGLAVTHRSVVGMTTDGPPQLLTGLPSSSSSSSSSTSSSSRFSTKSWLSQTCQVCRRSLMFGVKCKLLQVRRREESLLHSFLSSSSPSPSSPPPLPQVKVPQQVHQRCSVVQDFLPHLPSDAPGRVGAVGHQPPDRADGRDHAAVRNAAQDGERKGARPPPGLQQQRLLRHLLRSLLTCTFTAGWPPQHQPPPTQRLLPFPRYPPHTPPHTHTHLTFQLPRPPATRSWGNLQRGALPSRGQLRLLTFSGLSQFNQEAGSGECRAPPGRRSDGRIRQGRMGKADFCSQEAESPAEAERGLEERDEDELEELPTAISRGRGGERWRGPISRKVSQTSVYLQEWDIPYEQLQLGELIGKGRWGKVHKGRWHGEVAIRLLEVAGDQQEHLKLFKKEVMNYRQTRHDNVILFMGACMVPPHLAIVTSFCRGATLYSMVRERAATLDLNRTRQIARDIVNGMSYLHAKGIVHKDLKSKNVFYHTNKVVITDFGLFGMSGLVQQGRKKTVLRIPHGWIYYLAPEIVKQMGPEVDEDQLPFSKAADVYAFGTVWYELHSGGWPLASQPVEAKIWLLGSGEGVRKELADANLGKEITEIVSTCWSPEASARPTFSQLAGMLERLPKLNRRLSHPGHF
ncbi:unnamed protein product, partial [Tetraodon nigroviridis]